MRLSSWFLLSGSALAAGLIESSLAGSAPYPLSHVRPLLPGVVLLILLNRPQAGFVAAGIAGSISDLLKTDSSAFAIARWLMVAFMVDYVSEKVMTNRSLQAAWILTVIARLLDYILLLISYWISPIILQRTLYIETWKDFIVIAFFDLVIVTILFIGFTVFTKRFLISVPLTKNRYE
ncbi:hypothetical protein KKG46_05425 [Patescibacteria group bacterium]|nr:hypothetical protein [Patescibacteria group bacterium]